MPHTDPVSVGLATKLGIASGALGLLLAALATVLGGDNSTEAIAALIAAALPIYATITGRMNQASAALTAPVPLMLSTDQTTMDVPVPPVSSDELLAEQGILTEDLGEHA